MNERAILLAGGQVVDGTGAPARRGDVLVVDGRIAAVEPTIEHADAITIDVTGNVVTPGFIDLHSHADLSLLAFPSADSALRQGVTTVAIGNCGGGPAPLRHGEPAGAVAFGYDPAWGIDTSWSSFGEYTGRLDGTGINVAPLVAHGALRNAAMGLEQRAAHPDEVRSIVDALGEALDEGAFGMSTGLEYQPGMWADPGELGALVATVGARSRLYATHMRDRAAGHGTATAEAVDAARNTGARLQLSHFASRPNAPDAARDEAFRRVADAAEAGLPVGIDTFPEVWGPALLIDLLPPWALEGEATDVLGRLRDPHQRARIEDEVTAAPRFLAEIAGYAQIYVSDTPDGSITPGTALTELAAQRGVPVVQACLDLLLHAGTDFRAVAIRHVYATEDDLRRTLSLPYCSVASDGVVTSGEGADCKLRWSASAYGYAARTLEYYVHDVGFFTLEEAVRRMTSLPAEQLGLADRGAVRVGAHADLVVFDPATIHDRSTPDDMARHPTGIHHVLVNGQLAVDRGRSTSSRSGRLLQP